MTPEKDFFPILKKIIRDTEKFFDSTDIQFHNEFHQTAKKEPYLYLWFNEETKTIHATFKPPQSLLVVVTKTGWHTKGHTLQFGETPLSMIGLNQDITITVFKQKTILNNETKGLQEGFIKKLKEIDNDFLIP